MQLDNEKSICDFCHENGQLKIIGMDKAIFKQGRVVIASNVMEASRKTQGCLIASNFQ